MITRRTLTAAFFAALPAVLGGSKSAANSPMVLEHHGWSALGEPGELISEGEATLGSSAPLKRGMIEGAYMEAMARARVGNGALVMDQANYITVRDGFSPTDVSFIEQDYT